MQESGMWYDLLLSGAVSLAVCALFHAGLARKVWNVQCDLAATQAQLLRERNQRASLSRSKDKESLELFDKMKSAPVIEQPKNHLAKFGIGR